MSQTVAVLERTQEFVNSLLFSAAAAHSRAATHPGPHESCVTGKPCSRSAGRDYYEHGTQPGGGDRLARGLSVPDIDAAFKHQRLAIAVQAGGVRTWRGAVAGLRSPPKAGCCAIAVRSRLELRASRPH